MPNIATPAFVPQHAEDDGGLYIDRDHIETDHRSKLQRSKEAPKRGGVVNACKPHFGCQDGELDEQGYCKHLIGFTDPNDERLFYPMEMREGGRYRFVNHKKVQLVQPGDVLVKERVASRVYRDVDGPAQTTEAPPPETFLPAAAQPPADRMAELLRIVEWAKQNGYQTEIPAQTQPTPADAG